MNYASIKDAKELYGDTYVLVSADRDADGKPDNGALVKALTLASSEIDTYLANRYDLPLENVPPILVQYAVDIAIYKLSYGPGGGLTEEKTQRYKDAIAWLTKVAKGEVQLGLPAEEETATEHIPQFINEPRAFSRSKLGAW